MILQWLDGNLASMTQYVYLHDDHLAACDGGLDDSIPLMTVEMFHRPTGGIQSVLESMNRKIKIVYSMSFHITISVINYSIEPGVSFCIICSS